MQQQNQAAAASRALVSEPSREPAGLEAPGGPAVEQMDMGHAPGGEEASGDPPAGVSAGGAGAAMAGGEQAAAGPSGKRLIRTKEAFMQARLAAVGQADVSCAAQCRQSLGGECTAMPDQLCLLRPPQVWKRFMEGRGLDAGVSHPEAAWGLRSRQMGEGPCSAWAGASKAAPDPHRRLPSPMPLTQPQLFNRQQMDLFKLFRLVMKAGGYEALVQQKGWVSKRGRGGGRGGLRATAAEQSIVAGKLPFTQRAKPAN